MDFGIWSLLPPLITIVLAIVTRQTIFSLLVGCFVGAVMLSGGNPILGAISMINDYMIPSMASDFNANLLLFVALIGGFMGVLRTSGASKGLENLAVEKIKSRKGALTLTWASCFAFIFTEPSVIVGYIMRPITDRFKIPRVKLAYITDAMGAPVATVSPLAPHTSFIVSLLVAEIAALGLGFEGWELFFKSIPYVLYSWLAILVTLMVIRTGVDFGPMLDAEKRALETGEVIGPEDRPMIVSQPISDNMPEDANVPAYQFFIPLITLIGTVFAYILWSGDVVSNGFLGAFMNTHVLRAISYGVFAATVVAIIIPIIRRTSTLDELMDGWLAGASGQFIVFAILVLAWSIGGVIGNLGLAGYLAGIVGKANAQAIIPAVIFLVGCLVAFATGSSWGVYSIMIPIAVPIAVATDISLPLIIGASISGGLFGDHCSPISDTTIMSSAGAACDHIEHVRTQIPYALTIAISIFIGYLVAGLSGLSWLSIVISFVLTPIVFIVFNRASLRKEKAHA